MKNNPGVNIDTAPSVLRKLEDGREYRNIQLQNITARARENRMMRTSLSAMPLPSAMPTVCMTASTTRSMSRLIPTPLMSAI